MLVACGSLLQILSLCSLFRWNTWRSAAPQWPMTSVKRVLLLRRTSWTAEEVSGFLSLPLCHSSQPQTCLFSESTWCVGLQMRSGDRWYWVCFYSEEYQTCGCHFVMSVWGKKPKLFNNTDLFKIKDCLDGCREIS